MLPLGVKVLRNAASKVARPSKAHHLSIERRKGNFFERQPYFRFSSIVERRFTSKSHVSTGKPSAVHHDNDNWEDAHNNVSILAFDYPDHLEENKAFVPGDIFRDEQLLASESADDSAEGWMASMESSPTSLDQFVLSLRRYIKTNQWERIELLWNTQFNETKNSTFEPDYQAYVLLMRSYSELDGKYDAAKSLFQTIKSKNFSLTAEIYAYAVLAAARDRHPDYAMELFESAKSAQLTWTFHDIRVLMRGLSLIQLNAPQFVSLVSPLLELSSKRVPQENSTISRRTKQHKKSVELEMYGYALSIALLRLDRSLATEYASKIIKDTDTTLFTNTIVRVARWYIEKREFKEARDFVNHAVLKDRGFGYAGIHQPIVMPPRLSILLLELSILTAERNKRGDAEKAVLPQFYSMLDSYGPRDALVLSNFMLKLLLTRGLYDELFEVAKHVEKLIGSALPLTSIFNFQMRAHLQLHQLDKVFAILTRMQEDRLHQPNPHTSTVLVALAAKHHGCAEARNLLEHIIETVGIPLVGAFRAVIRAYCLENRVESAMEVIQLMNQHGLRVTWETYTPIMEVYERLNLLGKQFTLYHELLTKHLRNDTPSPDLITKLIFGCLRQGYLKVGLSLAKAADSHNVPRSAGLLASLLELYQNSNMKDKVLELATMAEEKMKSTENSKAERVKFGNLAMRAYSYLKKPTKVVSLYNDMKANELPLNIGTLNTFLAFCIRHKKISAGIGLYKLRESEFGPHVAAQALTNPNTIALVMRLANRSKFSEAKAKWQQIVEASRFRRAAYIARRQPTNTEESKEAESSVLTDTPVDELMHGERSEVELVELEEAQLESTDYAATTSHADNEQGTTGSSETNKQFEGIPNVTLNLATTILELAHDHMSTEAKFILEVAKVCDEFQLPYTNFRYTIHAQALIRLNLEIPLSELLEKMYSSHVFMSRSFYHSLISEASKVTYYRHRLGLAVFRFMTSRAGRTSEAPNQSTWTLLFTCINPKQIGLYLKDYLDAPYPLDSTLQLSIARSLLLYHAPIDAAINDTFVLINAMKIASNVIPSMKTLTILLSVVVRPQVLPIWKAHYYQLLLQLKQANSLNWEDRDFKEAVEFSIKTHDRRFAKMQKKSQANKGASEETAEAEKLEEAQKPSEEKPKETSLDPHKSPLELLADFFTSKGVDINANLPQLKPYKLDLSTNYVPKTNTYPRRQYSYPKTHNVIDTPQPLL